MSMDLIISKHGDVIITSNKTFGDNVTRVDFDIVQKKLKIQHDYVDNGTVLNIKVPNNMMPMMLKAPAITLAHVSNDVPVSGYIVPLIQSEIICA